MFSGHKLDATLEDEWSINRNDPGSLEEDDKCPPLTTILHAPGEDSRPILYVHPVFRRFEESTLYDSVDLFLLNDDMIFDEVDVTLQAFWREGASKDTYFSIWGDGENGRLQLDLREKHVFLKRVENFETDANDTDLPPPSKSAYRNARQYELLTPIIETPTPMTTPEKDARREKYDILQKIDVLRPGNTTLVVLHVGEAVQRNYSLLERQGANFASDLSFLLNPPGEYAGLKDQALRAFEFVLLGLMSVERDNNEGPWEYLSSVNRIDKDNPFVPPGWNHVVQNVLWGLAFNSKRLFHQEDRYLTHLSDVYRQHFVEPKDLGCMCLIDDSKLEEGVAFVRKSLTQHDAVPSEVADAVYKIKKSLLYERNTINDDELAARERRDFVVRLDCAQLTPFSLMVGLASAMTHTVVIGARRSDLRGLLSYFVLYSNIPSIYSWIRCLAFFVGQRNDIRAHVRFMLAHLDAAVANLLTDPLGLLDPFAIERRPSRRTLRHKRTHQGFMPAAFSMNGTHNRSSLPVYARAAGSLASVPPGAALGLLKGGFPVAPGPEVSLGQIGGSGSTGNYTEQREAPSEVLREVQGEVQGEVRCGVQSGEKAGMFSEALRCAQDETLRLALRSALRSTLGKEPEVTCQPHHMQNPGAEANYAIFTARDGRDHSPGQSRETGAIHIRRREADWIDKQTWGLDMSMWEDDEDESDGEWSVNDGEEGSADRVEDYGVEWVGWREDDEV